MIKKSLAFVAVVALVCAFSVPAQAQFGKVGKSLGKVAKDAGGAVTAVAGDMAADVAANKVSSKVAEWMDKNNVVSAADSDYTKRLTKVVGEKYVNVDGLTLNYKVYENAEVNILATADGSIRVYSGMMDMLNDDELAAIIATEIGHIANKDVRNSLMKVASEDNASSATGAQLEKMLSFSGDKLGSIVNEFLQVPFTDEQKQSADDFAIKLLKKNGAKTAALGTALSKFADLENVDEDNTEDETKLAAAGTVSKYVKVHPNNSIRASLVSSK